MISVIISSIDKKSLENIQHNIANTVGVQYEIVAFDNASGRKGLCEIYNEGVRKARYDILCFMHEDVEILTPNWGKIIVDYFTQDSSLGLIGIAGSGYKSAIPGSWATHDQNCFKINYINIIQLFKRIDREPVHDYENPKNEKITRVVCVDGVWLCTPKYVAQEVPWDEENLKGFHGYDIDFSLSVGTKYKVAVTFEVLIKHFSEGHFGYSWLKDILKVHKKWNHLLPLNYEILDRKQIAIIEKKTFRGLVKPYNKYLSIAQCLKILNSSKVFNVSKVTYIKLLYTIIREYFKRLFQKSTQVFLDE